MTLWHERRARWSMLLVLAGCRNPDASTTLRDAAAPMADPEGLPELFEADDGAIGFRDATGRIVLPARYHAGYPFNERGVAHVVDDDGWACINPRGEVLLRPFVYDNGPDDVREGLMRYTSGGKVGFADESCTVVIEAAWDFAGPFSHGRAPVCRGCAVESDDEHAMLRGGRWGFIDAKGHEVVALEWDFVYPFEGDTATVERGTQTRRIDREGQVLPPSTAIRFVGADAVARELASELAARRQALAQCGDAFETREPGSIGFVTIVLEPTAATGPRVTIRGLGDAALHDCIATALEGITPAKKPANFTVRFGTPPAEASRDSAPSQAGIVLLDDGTCRWIDEPPCARNKICSAPEDRPVACPEIIP